jgi:arylsulfatase A-like enzyme
MGRDTGNGLQVPSDAPYTGRPWAAVERNYAAMVGLLDRQVAQLVDRLKRQGLYDNTLILFSSDNGPHREGGHDPDFFHSSGPLRGIKRDLTEGGIRVPAIAVWPGKIPAGKTSDQPWAFWDVLPTVCDLAGVKSPAGIDGSSQWEAWQGKGSRAHGPFYWEFHERGFTQAVRDGQWKAIRNGKGKIELYDLVADLGEQNNLAERHPEMVRRMEELLRSMRTPDSDYPVPGL